MAGTITFQIDGIDRLIAAFAKAPEIISKEIRVAMKEELEQTIVDVISAPDKGYVTRSGMLDKSMEAEVSPDGLSGEIRLSNTIASAPYAIIQHEGGVINQTVTKRQSIYLTNRFNKYIAPGSKLTITIPAHKFLTRMWQAQETAARIVSGIGAAINSGIKKAGF